MHLRQDGAWKPAVDLHVRSAAGDWARARKVFVYRQNPQVNSTDPITFGWHFAGAFAPPAESVLGAAAYGPQEEVIDPMAPVNVRVSWAPQSSDAYAGYSVAVELKYAGGPNAGGTISTASGSPQDGYVDVAIASAPWDVYADVYYVNEAGSGPHVQTNTARIG
jgi:hypothetical protein